MQGEAERTEAVGVSGRVVRAAIAALVSVGGSAGVLGDDDGEVVVEGGIAVVSDEGGGAAGGVASHVLVEVGDDGQALGGVVAEDVGRAQETLLLTTVPVELNGVCGREASLSNDTEGLQNNDGTGGVVVSARGTAGGRAGG